MDYKLLTKDELIHLLELVIGKGLVKEKIENLVPYQKKTGLRCWDCISIRNKLLGKEDKV